MKKETQVKPEKLWTRNFTLAFIAGFFTTMVVYSFITTMAVYSMDVYGASEGLAGLTASIAMIGGILGRIFTGKYMERAGRRRMALSMSILSAVTGLLYFLPGGNVLSILLIRLSQGFTGGGVHNVMMTTVIDFVPASRKAEGIAIYTLTFSIGTAVGPGLSLFIISQWSYEVFWIFNFGYAVAATLIILAIRFAPSAFTEEQMAQLRSMRGLRGVFEKTTLPVAAIIVLLCVCFSGVASFVEKYTLDLGVAWIASLFFVVYAFGLIVARPVAGRFVDRRGENFVIIPTIVFFIISLVVMGLAGVLSVGLAPLLILVAAFVMAAGYGTFLPMGQAIAVKYAEPHRVGNAVSTYFIFADAGIGVGALILGSFASRIGFSNTFYVATVIVVAALILYWQLHGKHHRGLVSP
jgi:MFS family permease